MEKSAIQFSVFREDGQVIGFSLIGVGETEAEAFCTSFPSAVSEKKAEIVVEGPQIFFKHSGYHPEHSTNVMLYSDGGEFSAEVDEGDALALTQLLNLEGVYRGRQLHCSHILAWGKGFELKAVAS